MSKNQGIRDSEFTLRKSDGKWWISTYHMPGDSREFRPADWKEFETLEDALLWMPYLWRQQQIELSDDLRHLLGCISHSNCENLTAAAREFDQSLP